MRGYAAKEWQTAAALLSACRRCATILCCCAHAGDARVELRSCCVRARGCRGASRATFGVRAVPQRARRRRACFFVFFSLPTTSCCHDAAPYDHHGLFRFDFFFVAAATLRCHFRFATPVVATGHASPMPAADSMPDMRRASLGVCVRAYSSRREA